jgi:putative peptidoglycan lipid II flippase
LPNLSKNIRLSLLRSGTKIASLTLLSRVFGLVRELFIAQIFGVSAISDCVNVAFKLPNLFRRIFAEGAFSSVFIPIFNSKLLESKEKTQNFTGKVFSLLIVTLMALTGLMQIFMPCLMFVIAPGFWLEPEKFDLAVLLCRITMPYLIFISVTAFFGGILNSLRRFAAFAFVPVIFNIVIIFATLLKPTNLTSAGIAISYALLIAGSMQVLFMFICMQNANFNFSIIWLKRDDKDVKKLLKNMTPAAISAGAIQLNLFISQTIASFIPGAVSILAYADRIYQFPLSIIGVSFGTILLPELSKIYKSSDPVRANKLQNKAIKLAALISMPAAVGIWILSHPIIHILYERGTFDSIDTIKTAETLAAFAFGLPAFIFIKILTPIFYANHDQKTPLKITIYSMIVNTVLNIILMQSLLHIGIARGSSIAAWVNVLLLYKYARATGYFKLDHSIFSFCIKLILSCIVMTLFLKIFNAYYEPYYYSSNFLIKTFALTAGVCIGILSFSLSCLGFGMHWDIKPH